MKCLTHGRYWINMSWPKNIKNLYFQHQCWHNQLSIALYLRWLWESLWKPSTAFLWHHKSLKQYFWQYRWNSSILRDDNQFISVQFSHSVVSDSSRPHESQQARPLCPSPSPRVHSNLCPWSRWCHPAISSSVIPFSCCPQSLPASESFPMSQLFAWGGQSTGV